MDIADLFQTIAERYGLLPVYALIIGWGGLQAGNIRALLTVLSIMAGVYVVMFQAFDLKQDLDVFHLAERFGLSPDLGNSIAAVAFVYGLGFALYALKRMFVRQPKD